MSPDFWTFTAHLLWRGLQVTILVTVLGTVLALVTAFVAGLGRLSDHGPVRWIALAFIEVFRGTSLVAQLFFFFYALPAFGVRLAPMFAGVLAIGLNEGSYAAEIVRSAIGSRGVGQNEACVSLHMGKALRMRRVLIPQSIPAMLPPFGNVTVDLLKNSSLVSLVTVGDMTFQAQIVRNQFGNTTVVFAILLVIYFILSQLIALLSRWLERRFALDRDRRSAPEPRIRYAEATGGSR
ncbi:MAG TPA: ectoine/hydroxyectoine ABC transporter permease subunit EhuC [Nocardioidaceae bacterium]|nr:ectoine/hydroxyectoine ABC transporter permease subunit EhuC [Nocardioidaceae bacterium]